MRYTNNQKKILEQTAGVIFINSVAGGGLTTTLVQKAYIEVKKLNKHEEVKLLDCNFSSIWSSKLVTNTHSFGQKVKFETLNNFVLDEYLNYKKEYSSIGQNEVYKIVKDVAKRLNIQTGDLIREHKKHCTTGIATKDKTILSAVRQIEDIKLSRKIATHDDAFNFFDNNKQLIQTISKKYPCILVDNFHNSSLQQVNFIRCLANNSRLLIVGGDDCQSIINDQATIIERRKLLNEYKNTSIRLKKSFTLSQENYALAKEIAGSIEKQSKIKTTISGSKPIYREFSNNEQQSDYITNTIKSLSETNVCLSECAIVSRTKASLVGMQLILNKEGIKTNDSFFKHLEYCECIQLLQSLVNIVKSTINGTAIPIEEVIRIIDFIGVENNELQMLVEKVQKGGINSLKISRKLGRIESDYLLTIRQALLKAPTLFPEEGIRILLDSLKPVFNSKYVNAKIIAGLLSSFKLASRNIKNWNDVNLFPLPERSDNGVTLCTFHKAISGHWKHVFLINVVDCIVPFTKYKHNASYMKDETGLFYSSITRATETVHVLYCPFHKHNYINNNDNENNVIHTHYTNTSPFVNNHYNLYSHSS